MLQVCLYIFSNDMFNADMRNNGLSESADRGSIAEVRIAKVAASMTAIPSNHFNDRNCSNSTWNFMKSNVLCFDYQVQYTNKAQGCSQLTSGCACSCLNQTKAFATCDRYCTY